MIHVIVHFHFNFQISNFQFQSLDLKYFHARYQKSKTYIFLTSMKPVKLTARPTYIAFSKHLFFPPIFCRKFPADDESVNRVHFESFHRFRWLRKLGENAISPVLMIRLMRVPELFTCWENEHVTSRSSSEWIIVIYQFEMRVGSRQLAVVTVLVQQASPYGLWESALSFCRAAN